MNHKPFISTELKPTKAAREYLATEPKPTLTEALAQQGIKLRTEFEPKQRDSELAAEPRGERAELIARLNECLSGPAALTTREATAIKDAADMLEADESPRTKPVDKGPWCAGMTKQDARVYVQSDDFKRDARLYVNGDFATKNEEYLYACALARQLNAAADKPTGWDNGLSQDYCAEFGQWLASRPGARQQIKEMFSSDAPK